MGLKMNIAKPKVMVVDNTPINVNNVLIEHVEGYVYLGQRYSCSQYSVKEFKDIHHNSCHWSKKSISSNLFDSQNISFRGLLSVMCSLLSSGYRFYLAT